MKLKDAIKKIKEMDLNTSDHDLLNFEIINDIREVKKIEAKTKRQTIIINIKLEVYE